MPYAHNSDLPPSVCSHLPEHVQDIYREAFNRAYTDHAGDPRQEKASSRNCMGGGKEALRDTGRAVGCKAVRR